MNTLINRFLSKTPKLFRIIRNIGLSVTGISATIIGAGLTLPDTTLSLITTIGLVSGAVAAGVAQLTTIWGIDENGNITNK